MGIGAIQTAAIRLLRSGHFDRASVAGHRAFFTVQGALCLFGVLTHIQLPIVSGTFCYAREKDPQTIIGDRVPPVFGRELWRWHTSRLPSGVSGNVRAVVGDVDHAQLTTHPLLQLPSGFWCEDDVAEI